MPALGPPRAVNVTRLIGLLLAKAALCIAALLWYRRRARGIPCPSWLSFLLENRYTDRVAGGRLLLDRAGIAPGMRVLDAGCGPGRLTIPAAERVGPTGEVVALDIQPAMLRRLEERLRGQGISNVRPIPGGLGQGLLPRDTFDRVLLVTVLGEVIDPDAALREIHTALRPGGILSVTEMLPDPDYQRLSVLRRRVASAGFRLERTFGTAIAYTANFVKPH